MDTLAIPYSRTIFGALPWYSVTMVTGIIVALLWASHEEKRFGVPKDTIVDLALWLIPCGVVGARLYYVFFAWDSFAADPISVLYIWKGGLAIYGAILGGALAAWGFAHKRRLSLLTLFDMIAPGLVLAQSVGRWGNYFNMEAYGLPLTNPALQFFPMGVLINEGGTQVWHMATFFYESLWDFLTFLTLAALRKRLSHRGDTFALYVCLYGAGRLLIEGLRMDSLMSVGGSARVSQLLSVAACIVVCALFILRGVNKRSKQTKFVCTLACLAGILGGLLLSAGVPDAFFGYRAAYCVKLGILLGGMAVSGAALWKQTPVKALLTLPCVLMLLGEGIALRTTVLTGAASSTISLIQCAWFSATLVTALLALVPFAYHCATASADPCEAPAEPHS